MALRREITDRQLADIYEDASDYAPEDLKLVIAYLRGEQLSEEQRETAIDFMGDSATVLALSGIKIERT